MSKEPTTEELAAQAHNFISPFKSIVLSTVDKQGQPHVSYAPHLIDQQYIYVFVSAMAKHSQTLNQGRANVFFLQDESSSKNVFARKRLTLECDVEAIENNSKAGKALLDTFEAHHGNTVGLLRSLPDFQLYQLKPQTALYVTGFGAAFELSDQLQTLLQ